MTRFLRQFAPVMTLFIIFTGALAADLNMVVRYGKTGGIKGTLNQVGDEINGVDICPAVNNNNNNVPGCDMFDDPGFNDGGTPQDGSDDSYNGDLIVRTNDDFTVEVNYNVNGTDEVTLEGTVPEGLAFDGLPGFCLLPESELADDGRTVKCYLGEKTNSTQTLSFPVRVLGTNQNGTTPGPVEFSVSGPSSNEVVDGTDESIIVTAAPRWNLRKRAYGVGAHTITTDEATTDFPEGTKGWVISYSYYIEILNETDPPELDALIGNESLGKNATIEFTDEISNLYLDSVTNPKGALLINCRTDYYSGSDPYPKLTSNRPADRSVTDSGEITCSQPGGGGADVEVKVEGADLSLEHFPAKSSAGVPLPAERKIAALGNIRVFVPLSDAQNTTNGNSLKTKNCITNFDPNSVSGLSNFNNGSEDESDNCYTRTLKVYDGDFGKQYRRSADPHSYYIPGRGEGQATYYRTGDGWVAPGEDFASFIYYSNIGGEDATDVVMCDVMDAAKYDVADISSSPGSAVYLQIINDDANNTLKNNINIQYATGYVSNVWPPSSSTGQAVVNECTDPGVVWYDTTTAARASGEPITKVRVTAQVPVQPGQKIYVLIKNVARDTYADTGALPSGISPGDEIPNGAILTNFATYKDGGEQADWKKGNYDPKTTMEEPHSGSPGDRLGLTRAFARISKETGSDDGINSVGLGQQFEYVLKPTFTSHGSAVNAANLTVVDVLPPGMSYVADSATQGGSPLEPQSYTCTAADSPHEACTQAGETVLVWDLGDRVPNEDIESIVFTAQVGFDNADGDILTNKVVIESPADGTPEEKRTATRSVVVSVPRELIVSKGVDHIRREIKDTGPYIWRVDLKNATSGPLQHVDIIDVLPYNGDSENPFGDDGTLSRSPSSRFKGELHLVSAKLGAHPDPTNGECGDGSNPATYYYTNVNPSTINLDPHHSSNNLAPPNSIWCEGTSSGPNAGCGFSVDEVTAVRVRSNNDVTEGSACRLEIETSPAPDSNGQWHLKRDRYTNNAVASADGLALPAATNNITVRIYASSLGDFAWQDSNGNGIQDAGEPGIEGVKVYLLDDNGNPVDDPTNPGTHYEKTTDSSGKYLFENLPSGNYQLRFEAPSSCNCGITAIDQGTDDERDSDIDPSSGIARVSLAARTDDTSYDAGYYPLRAIGDTVFHDEDNDGQFDSGEGMGGVTVTLTPPRDVDLGNGPGQPVSTTTDNQGHYRFENLPAGQYTVEVNESTLPLAALRGHNTVDPDGGNDSKAQVTLARSSDNLNQDFGYFLNAADLSLTKTVDNNQPAVGSQVTFTIALRNEGPLTATGVAVTDRLPSGYAFISADASQGSYDSQTGVWSVGSLARGANATLELKARVVDSADTSAYENWAEVSASDLPDIDSVPGVGDDHGHGQDDGKDGDPGTVDDDEASATLGRKLHVRGTIYHDLDVNQAMDGSDPAIDPVSDLEHLLFVKVFTDADGDCSTTGDRTFTEAVAVQPNGSYDFANAEPDTNYCFVLDDNADGTDSTPWNSATEGWLYVNPATGLLPVSVHADDVFDQDFGLFHGSKVSGTVFYDDGLGAGANANNVVQDGQERGVSGAPVTISDGTHTRTTLTDADGNYTLYLPADWGLTELSHGGGRGTGYNEDGVSPAYTATDVHDLQAVRKLLDPATLAGGGTETNFGVVREGSFIPNQNGQTIPGGTVVYPHIYTPGSEGELTFSLPSGGWNYRIRVDLNGDGDFNDPNEEFRPIGNGQELRYTVDDDWPRNPDGSLAGVPVEIEVTAPADAYNGQVDIAPIESQLVWANNPNVTESRSVTDVTTVSTQGLAEITKSVRNVTAAGEATTRNEAAPGDMLEYCLDYRNPSQQTLTEVVVRDPIPTQVNYVSGSLTLNGGALSDAVDADSGEVVDGRIAVRVGELAPGATGRVCFLVRVP